MTVVCEPDDFKDSSLSDQMDFAESTLDALEGKDAPASNALLLIQCGSDEFRPPVDATFVNVVEVVTYDAEVAKQLAQTIFRLKR